MKIIKYVSNLTSALTEYNKTVVEIKKLEQRKQEINMQIRQWFSMNDIENSFEIADLNNIITQLSSKTSTRNSVVDYDILKTILAKTGNESLVVEKETETFTIRTLKKHTPEWVNVESRKYTDVVI